MLEGSEEDAKYVLPVSRCSDYLHDFIDDHYTLFSSKVDSINAAMGARAEDDGMGIGAMEALFVEDNWDILLLEIVELGFSEVADPKGVSNGGYEYRVPVDQCTGC